MPIRVRITATLHDSNPVLPTLGPTLQHLRIALCGGGTIGMIEGPFGQSAPVCLAPFDGFDPESIIEIQTEHRPDTWDAEPFPQLEPGDVVLADYLVSDATAAHFTQYQRPAA